MQQHGIPTSHPTNTTGQGILLGGSPGVKWGGSIRVQTHEHTRTAFTDTHEQRVTNCTSRSTTAACGQREHRRLFTRVDNKRREKPVVRIDSALRGKNA